MSSRALRKLQQEKELESLDAAPSDDDVSIARPTTGARARMPNPFELVNFLQRKNDYLTIFWLCQNSTLHFIVER